MGQWRAKRVRYKSCQSSLQTRGDVMWTLAEWDERLVPRAMASDVVCMVCVGV